MWRKDDLFTVTSPNGMNGRVVGSRLREQPAAAAIQKEQPKVSKDDLRQVLVEAVLKETDIPDLDSSLKNLPFESAKKLSVLRTIEVYLMAQLTQVRKEITKVTQESVTENEVKDGKTV